jgi:hypothetical protein
MSDLHDEWSIDQPALSTRSARSSNTLPPCMTITLEAISSILYACASFWTAKARKRRMRIADIAGCRPLPTLPSGLMPRACAVAHVLLLRDGAPRVELNSAEERPEEALTDSSEASSMRRRIAVTDLRTPGSMGGGIGPSGW